MSQKGRGALAPPLATLASSSGREAGSPSLFHSSVWAGALPSHLVLLNHWMRRGGMMTMPITLKWKLRQRSKAARPAPAHLTGDMARKAAHGAPACAQTCYLGTPLSGGQACSQANPPRDFVQLRHQAPDSEGMQRKLGPAGPAGLGQAVNGKASGCSRAGTCKEGMGSMCRGVCGGV